MEDGGWRMMEERRVVLLYGGFGRKVQKVHEVLHTRYLELVPR